MIHHLFRLSKYLSHPTNKKYATIVKSALFRRKKTIGERGTCLVTLIDRPNLSVQEIVDKGFQGGPILALAPRGHSLRIPGMSRKRAALKGFWSRAWLYQEVKDYVGDEGDWTMPVSPNWKPSCWLRVRDMKNLPPWIIDKIVIPIDLKGHNRKVLSRYLAPFEISHPTNELLNEMYASPTGDAFIEAVSRNDDEFDTQRAWEAFVKRALSLKKTALSGWEILEMCQDNESWHVNVSGWPLKYVNPEYLQWMVCDQRTPRTERFPGFVKPTKDPKTWFVDGPIKNEGCFTPYDPLKSKIEGFLKQKENEGTFLPPYACSSLRGVWSEEEWERPWREDYTTGKWRGRLDRVIPEDRQSVGLSFEQYKEYLKDRRNAFPPPEGTHVERFESLGTNKWHKWLWQGRTPFSGKEGEEPEEYELTEELGYDTTRTMSRSGEWTPPPRDTFIEDLPPRKAPDSEEEIFEQLLSTRERVTNRLRYFEKIHSRPGTLSRKDELELFWEHDECRIQIDLWRADLWARIWPTMIAFGLWSDSELFKEVETLINELEAELDGCRTPPLEEEEKETPREEEEDEDVEYVIDEASGEVSREFPRKKCETKAWVNSLKRTLSREPELVKSLELDHLV